MAHRALGHNRVRFSSPKSPRTRDMFPDSLTPDELPKE